MPDAMVVVPVDGAVDTVITSDGGPPPLCDPEDPHVVACYPFDGDARDGGPHHLDATASGVRFLAGKVGTAMLFEAAGAAEVDDSPLFDVAALTIEAWINLSELPADGDRAFVLDSDRQYALFVRPGGDLSCTLVASPTITISAPSAIGPGEWHHVACTYEADTARLYVDGVQASSTSGGGVLATSGITGISIGADNPRGSGSRLIGFIDELRLTDNARPPAQICADAGKRSCP